MKGGVGGFHTIRIAPRNFLAEIIYVPGGCLWVGTEAPIQGHPRGNTPLSTHYWGKGDMRGLHEDSGWNG